MSIISNSDKGRASDNEDILRNQPEEMNDHEKAGEDKDNEVRESGSQFTLKKPEGIKEAAQSKHSPEFSGFGIDEKAGWKLGDIWPKGKKIMGLYLILDILGEGGMGLVYKAMDLATNRPVVIKSLRPCFAQHEVIKGLFRREAESWVKIGVHPNIIRAYDIREIEYLPRVIAEYADVGSLDSLLDPGLLMDNAMDIAIQICWGMAYAHDKGLVHRDLKPDNIFLTKNGTVKVADFGLAKIIDLREGIQEGIGLRGGRDGQTIGDIGTHAYMAPEQWQGRAGKEADIYSFGVVMYELFCGRRPFYFPNADEDARYFLYKNAHENERPPRPEELRSDLPSRLAGLIFKCLEKEALARPKDFRSIARILNEVSQEHFKKSLPQEPTKEELDCQTKLDQAWALLRLGISSKFQGDLDQAMKLWEDALETFRALGHQGGMSACYNNMGVIIQDRDEYDRALQMFEKSLSIAKALGDQHNLSMCYNNMGGLFEHLGKYKRALEMLEKGLSIAEPLVDRTVMSMCYNNMGRIFEHRGEYNRALQMYEKSLRIDEALGDQASMSACYNNMGSIFANRDEYVRALQMFEKSLSIRETIGDQAGMSKCYVNMGYIFTTQYEYDKALQMFEKSLSIAKALGDQIGKSGCYYNMGNTFYSQGEYDRALQMLEKSLCIAEALGYKSGMSKCYRFMGIIFKDQGRYDKALQMYEKGLSIAKALGEQDGMRGCYNNMGNIFVERDEYDKALQMFEKSLSIAEALGDQDGISGCYLDMGYIFAHRGGYDKALLMFEKSLKIAEAIGDQAGMSKCYHNMGNIFNKRVEYDRALQLYEKSLRIMEATGDQDGISNCYRNKGNIFYARGEYDRALQMWEKSLAIMCKIGDPDQKAVAQNIAILKQKLGK